MREKALNGIKWASFSFIFIAIINLAQLSILARYLTPSVVGVRSLVPRNEEAFYSHQSDTHNFYKSIISTYKFTLVEWYVKHWMFFLDIKIMLLIALAIVWRGFSPWRFFRDLPRIPEEMLDLKVQLQGSMCKFILQLINKRVTNI